MTTIARKIGCWLLAALVWLPVRPAGAMVVVPVATNVNTSAPSDDPGWLNVGDVGIYVGNRWVITANHVGANPVTNFPGVGSFSLQSGSGVRLQNPMGLGLSTDTDLLMYRLTTDPGLPWLRLPTAPPNIGAEVTLIGDGASVTPNTAETQWTVTGTPPNLVWTLGGMNPNASGYQANTAQKMWGTNLVEDDDPFFATSNGPDYIRAISSGNGDVLSFMTEFDKVGETVGAITDHEAQALSGDSGSAVFAKDGTGWVLAGVTHAIGIFDNQPGGTTTAVFGDLTFFADLSKYGDQILAISGIPEPGGFALVGAAAALACFAAQLRRRAAA